MSTRPKTQTIVAPVGRSRVGSESRRERSPLLVGTASSRLLAYSAEGQGLHRVTIRRLVKHRLRIGPIEVLDGTPVVDIEPVLDGRGDF